MFDLRGAELFWTAEKLNVRPLVAYTIFLLVFDTIVDILEQVRVGAKNSRAIEEVLLLTAFLRLRVQFRTIFRV